MTSTPIARRECVCVCVQIERNESSRAVFIAAAPSFINVNYRGQRANAMRQRQRQTTDTHCWHRISHGSVSIARARARSRIVCCQLGIFTQCPGTRVRSNTHTRLIYICHARTWAYSARAATRDSAKVFVSLQYRHITHMQTRHVACQLNYRSLICTTAE